jgi:hypothetical protein
MWAGTGQCTRPHSAPLHACLAVTATHGGRPGRWPTRRETCPLLSGAAHPHRTARLAADLPTLPHCPCRAGRMQSAQLALDFARRCVAEGRRQKVVVFMHDLERVTERRIAEELYQKEPHMFFLGTMDGAHGNLSAWEYSKNIRPRIARSILPGEEDIS